MSMKECDGGTWEWDWRFKCCCPLQNYETLHFIL